MVPIMLYQAEQILCGQIVVILFRRWLRNERMSEHDSADEDTIINESGTVQIVKAENIKSEETRCV